jgi:hypothetical protein
MKKLILSTLIATALILAGCEASSTPSNPVVPPAPTNDTNVVTPPAAPTQSSAETFILNNGPLIQTAASVATGAVLNFAESTPAQRTQLANEIYSAANAVNSLATGTIPTQQQVHDTIVSFGGNGASAQYVAFATSFSGLYGSYVAQLNGDSKAAVALLSDLALGAQQAASAYTTVSALATPAKS